MVGCGLLVPGDDDQVHNLYRGGEMTELFLICGMVTCVWFSIWLARNLPGSALYSRGPSPKKKEDEPQP